MGTFDRAARILKSYINREWERIESLFQEEARKELDEFLTQQDFSKELPPSESTDKLAPPFSKTETRSLYDLTWKMDIPTAYRILNLTPRSTLRELKTSYKRLSERSQPDKFPEGSEERKKAAVLHLRVQEAYELLLPVLDPRSKRFQSLDVE